MEKTQETFKKEQAFLFALSDLMQTHKVAISSFEETGIGCSEVVFQFSEMEGDVQHNLHTGRLHNTVFDIISIAARNTTKKTEPIYDRLLQGTEG